MKSIGLALLMALPTANESTGRVGGLEHADPILVHPARDNDLHVTVPSEVEARPHLLHELGGHAAALGRRVEPDPVQPLAEGIGDAERLFGLVLERVHEDDPRHLRVDVAVEGLGGADRVAEDQDEGMRHRPRRGEAREPRAGRGRRTDAAADDRGVIHLVGHARMHVPRSEADDRNRIGRVDDPARGRRPSRAAGKDAEDGGFVQAEGRVASGDPHHDLLRLETVPVVE